MDVLETDKKQPSHPIQGEASTQLKFEIRPSKRESWYKLKEELSYLERVFANLPFWRSWVNIFTLITIILTLCISFFVLYYLWDMLPDEVPLFYSNEGLNWELYPKQTLVYISTVIITLEALVYIISFKIFTYDRRLAIVLNWIVSMSSILFIIAFSQLLALILI